MKSNRSSAVVAALVLAAAVQVWAQDPPKEDPSKQEPPKPEVQQGPTFDDLKKDLGDLKSKQDKEDGEKREAQVQKNMEDTLRIYGEVLNGRGNEQANVDKRLKINGSIEQKYTKQLDASRSELARLRSAYVNRTLTLKKSLDEKKIGNDAYEKLLEEDTRKYRNREKELIDDIAFFEQELVTARKTNKDLSVKKELLEFDPFQPEDAASADPKAGAPKTTLAERLQRKVWGLSGYRTKSVVDAID